MLLWGDGDAGAPAAGRDQKHKGGGKGGGGAGAPWSPNVQDRRPTKNFMPDPVSTAGLQEMTRREGPPSATPAAHLV